MFFRAFEVPKVDFFSGFQFSQHNAFQYVAQTAPVVTGGKTTQSVEFYNQIAIISDIRLMKTTGYYY